MLLGDTVPLGRLGRLSVKPARGVPKISFSAYLKERAERVREGESERD